MKQIFISNIKGHEPLIGYRLNCTILVYLKNRDRLSHIDKINYLPIKSILISIAVGLFVSFGTLAQKPVSIENKNIVFKHGENPGFIVSIPEVSTELVGKAWTKQQEKFTKSKVQNDGGELSIFGAVVKDVTAEPLNIYSYIKSQDSVCIMYVSFELKPKEYIKEESGEAFTKAKLFLLNFAKDQYLELANDQLKVQEIKLKRLNNELESTKKDKEKLEKMIVSNGVDVNARNDELVVMRSNVKTLNEELVKQNSQYITLEEGTIKEEKKKYINELEKRIKKTNRDIESSEKKIVELKEEALLAQNEGIPANLKEQERIKAEIEKQNSVVLLATEKCNNIKAF